MSTIPIVISHERQSGRLQRFQPLMRGAEAERRFLSVEAGLHAWLYEAGSRHLRETKAGIRAHLGEFVRGEPIDDLYSMKRIEDRRIGHDVFDHGVWTFSPRFKPQYRIFGFFVVTDWFVALSKESRDELERSNNQWHAQIDACHRLWSDLFPGRLPWLSNRIEQYVSQNVEKVDDRW